MLKRCFELMEAVPPTHLAIAAAALGVLRYFLETRVFQVPFVFGQGPGRTFFSSLAVCALFWYIAVHSPTRGGQLFGKAVLWFVLFLGVTTVLDWWVDPPAKRT
jgi:hypothetical protein